MFFLRQQRPQGMTAAEAIAQSDEGAITVIDVREHGEVANSGKAMGAIHIPLMRLRDMADPRHPDFIAELKDCGPIAVYCASGARSHSAAMMLQQMGYDEVHNIGGLAHWVQAGGALEQG
ncbi:rhodanese-like domain-containing protein [Thalassovita aquimarina]|uniref:rhodanese-like domain-containing protein n=1 Tax=Thalassovita aquimarina TaxID=2785917 RepID=UPI003568025D